MANQKNSVGEVQKPSSKAQLTREYRATGGQWSEHEQLRSTEIMSYMQYMKHQYWQVVSASTGNETACTAGARYQELDTCQSTGKIGGSKSGCGFVSSTIREISSKAANAGASLSRGSGASCEKKWLREAFSSAGKRHYDDDPPSSFARSWQTRIAVNNAGQSYYASSRNGKARSEVASKILSREITGTNKIRCCSIHLPKFSACHRNEVNGISILLPFDVTAWARALRARACALMIAWPQRVKDIEHAIFAATPGVADCPRHCLSEGEGVTS